MLQRTLARSGRGRGGGGADIRKWRVQWRARAPRRTRWKMGQMASQRSRFCIWIATIASTRNTAVPVPPYAYLPG